MSSPSHYAPPTTSTSTPRARSASGGRNAILTPSSLPVVSGDKAAGDIPQRTKLPCRKYRKTDTGATGDSADILTFANDVFDADNRNKIGTDEDICFHTVPGKAWECFWTLALGKGDGFVSNSLLVSSGNAWANRQFRLGHCAGLKQCE